MPLTVVSFDPQETPNMTNLIWKLRISLSSVGTVIVRSRIRFTDKGLAFCPSIEPFDGHFISAIISLYFSLAASTILEFLTRMYPPCSTALNKV